MGFKDSTLKKQNWCNFGMFLEIILYILCFIQYFHSFLACFFLSFQPAISSSHPPKNGEVSETSASSNPLDSPRTRAKVRFSLIVHRSGGWGNKIGQQKKNTLVKIGSLSHHLQGQGLQTCSIENGDGQQKDPTANCRFISMTPTLEESLQQLFPIYSSHFTIWKIHHE